MGDASTEMPCEMKEESYREPSYSFTLNQAVVTHAQLEHEACALTWLPCSTLLKTIKATKTKA